MTPLKFRRIYEVLTTLHGLLEGSKGGSAFARFIILLVTLQRTLYPILHRLEALMFGSSPESYSFLRDGGWVYCGNTTPIYYKFMGLILGISLF